MDTDEEIGKLPAPASIQEQFAKRSIFVVCNVDTVKHSPGYWLTNLMADDSNIEETDDRFVNNVHLKMCGLILTKQTCRGDESYCFVLGIILYHTVVLFIEFSLTFYSCVSSISRILV